MLAGVGFSLAFVSILALLLSPVPVAVKILVSPALMILTYLRVRRDALLGAIDSIVALGFGDRKGDGRLKLYLGTDWCTPVPCRVVRSHVSRNTVTARLTDVTSNRKHSLFLFRPMCDREEFRVLKRYLLSLEEPVAE